MRRQLRLMIYLLTVTFGLWAVVCLHLIQHLNLKMRCRPRTSSCVTSEVRSSNKRRQRLCQGPVDYITVVVNTSLQV